MTATQAPTPGPLSATAAFVEAFGQSLDRDFAFWSSGTASSVWQVLYPLWKPASEEIRLAPAAPVEASGSELKADFVRSHPSGLDDSTYEKIEDALDRVNAPITGPDGKFLTLVKRIDALSSTIDQPEVSSDDLRMACQAVLDDYQTSDAHHPDHVLIRRDDFERIKALVETPISSRPQPSGETREALDRLKMAAHVYEDDEMAADCATLEALLSARPLALGGQS